jgi:hypothetical protein
MATPTNNQILTVLYAIAPQFADPDADTLEVYNTLIAQLRCQVDTNVISCCAELAFAYLLAHLLTIRSNPYSGVSNNLKEGDLSIGLSVQPDGSILDSTSYGKLYKDLIKRKVFAPFVSNVPSNFSATGYNLYGSCGC